MTVLNSTHQSAVARAASLPRKLEAPAWVGRIAWFRLLALGLNFALWAVIILIVRALLRL